MSADDSTEIPAPNNKRQKKSAADDLVCPITLELPWDPVTAEDGRVYERKAIEEHIKTAQDRNRELKSPITNEKMGTRLLPNVWVKNLIETLIENGSITGSLADNWDKKAKEKKFMEDLLKKAGNGDQYAMLTVACNYFEGKNGFEEDKRLAYSWYKKTHEAGNAYGTYCIGRALCEGYGVEKNEKHGLMYISMAAARGSIYAAKYLGDALSNGYLGLDVDRAEAIRWFQKCLRANNSQYEILTDTTRQRIQRVIDLSIEAMGLESQAGLTLDM